MRDPAKALQLLSTPPASPGDFEKWTTCEDALNFVHENAAEEELVVYAGAAHAFIHAVAVPATRLQKPDPSDIMNWNCNAASGWGLTIEYTDPPRAYVSPPLDSTMSKTLDGAEQLVFARFFEGRLDDKTQFEVLQKFVHVFQLHYIPERSAYCRLDSRGDLEDMIRIVRFALPGNTGGNTVVTFRRSLVDEWLALTDSYIVQMFDFTRFRSGDFHGWQEQEKPVLAETPGFTYRSNINPGYAGYVRGYQIIRPRITKEQVTAKHSSFEDEPRQYASFIVMDWKNRKVCETSCGPDGCANYFTDSPLPFETSPAFFRPEVLVKYKADSEKYTLRDRSIMCRGTWDLRTYDINEAGQVHTYLCYLADLPYEEQLHWKAYNEAPKGTISRRAFKSDFEASWDFEYDPLENLRNRLREWDNGDVPFWTPRSLALYDQVHYPVTTSPDEWANELLHLDQLLVEGFEKKWLSTKATELSQITDPKWGSLKTLQACLVGLGFEETAAADVLKPMFELHEYRTKVKGHASGSEAVAIKKKALTEYKTFAGHFRALCAACDEALGTVAEALGRPFTEVPGE